MKTQLNWRMPDKKELNLMHENLHKKGVGGFADDHYWSSSEGSADLAWGQGFSNGLQGSYNKNATDRVRAVRDFESGLDYNIGDKTDNGIIFARSGRNYTECKFQDEPIEYSWHEAMKLFNQDGSAHEAPSLFEPPPLRMDSENAEVDSGGGSNLKEVRDKANYLILVWRMPTIDELNLMHNNLHKFGVGGFANDYYWSSSELDADFAWDQYFSNGDQHDYGKNGIRRVRAVRDFESGLDYNIGDKTDNGIIFARSGRNYTECKFQDEPIEYSWHEAMKLFNQDGSAHEAPSLFEPPPLRMDSENAEVDSGGGSNLKEVKEKTHDLMIVIMRTRYKEVHENGMSSLFAETLDKLIKLSNKIGGING